MSKEEGYKKLATLMNGHTEFAVFRRFGKLNFLNLLYLQAELTYLERDLKRLTEKDKTIPGRERYSKHWLDMSQTTGENGGDKQWKKMIQIREKLREYDEQLQQAVFLTSHKTGKSCDLAFLRDWLDRPQMGDGPIISADLTSWDRENDNDLRAVPRPESSDPLARWVINTFIPNFHRVIGKHFKKFHPCDPISEIAYYAEAPLHSAINIFVTVLASLIPISSIVVLYFVSNLLDRLVIIFAFTGLFAFCLAATTRARRVEIFAATSAFAAVQVVFMTGNNGSIA